MQQLPILYLTTTKLIVTKSIFWNKAKFLKMNLKLFFDQLVMSHSIIYIYGDNIIIQYSQKT